LEDNEDKIKLERETRFKKIENEEIQKINNMNEIENYKIQYDNLENVLQKVINKEYSI